MSNKCYNYNPLIFPNCNLCFKDLEYKIVHSLHSCIFLKVMQILNFTVMKIFNYIPSHDVVSLKKKVNFI